MKRRYNERNGVLYVNFEGDSVIPRWPLYDKEQHYYIAKFGYNVSDECLDIKTKKELVKKKINISNCIPTYLGNDNLYNEYLYKVNDAHIYKDYKTFKKVMLYFNEELTDKDINNAIYAFDSHGYVIALDIECNHIINNRIKIKSNDTTEIKEKRSLSSSMEIKDYDGTVIDILKFLEQTDINCDYFKEKDIGKSKKQSVTQRMKKTLIKLENFLSRLNYNSKELNLEDALTLEINKIHISNQVPIYLGNENLVNQTIIRENDAHIYKNYDTFKKVMLYFNDNLDDSIIKKAIYVTTKKGEIIALDKVCNSIIINNLEVSNKHIGYVKTRNKFT